MGNPKQQKWNIGGPPAPDDNWWAAILESVEANALAEQKPRRAGRPHTRKTASQAQSGKAAPTAQPAARPAGARSPQTAASESVRATSTIAAPAVLLESAQQATQDWDYANELYRQDQTVELRVTGHNRGGLLVEAANLKGFVPISHLVQIPRTCEPDNGVEKAIEAYLGKTVQLKVIECDPARGRVVLSERAAQAAAGRRLQLLDEIKKGDCLHGNVTTITDFGAFVDLGGMEGLVHISELSWGRVRHPRDVISVGENVQVTVLEVDRQRARVALSLKRLRPNPWENIAERYQVGQTADAVITSVVSYGAFARLDSGIDGLIHASEMGKNGEPPRPENLLREGQRVQVVILSIEPKRQRMGLRLQRVYTA